jgi:acetyltransferase-like isoleucine patch superfamily enzyme
MRRDLHGWVNLLASLGARLKSRLYYPLVFASFGRKSVLYSPVFVSNPKYIHIGDRVQIRPGARLETIVVEGAPAPLLRIGDNVNIEQNVHIVCHCRVLIEADVSITAFCSIVDTTHPIDGLGPDEKMGALVAPGEAEVTIGRGSFLGAGVRIQPGVRVGAGAVIGANSVVTKDVPEYSVAAGVPATIRRKRRMRGDR